MSIQQPSLTSTPCAATSASGRVLLSASTLALCLLPLLLLRAPRA